MARPLSFCLPMRQHINFYFQIVLFILGFSVCVNGQISLPAQDTFYGQDITANTSFYQDTVGNLSFSAIAQKKFMPYHNGLNSLINPHEVFWLKFTAHNSDSLHLQRAVFYAGKPFFLDLYSNDENGNVKVVEGGTNADWRVNYFSYDGYGLPIMLFPKQQKTFFVRIINDDFNQKKVTINPIVFSEASYKDFKNDLLHQKYGLLIFYFLTLGGLMFGSIFSIFQYIYKKDNALLYYTLVAFLSAIMLLRVAEYHLEIRLLSIFIPHLFSTLYIIQYTLGIVYFLFIISIFDLKTTLPVFYQRLRWIIGFYVLILLISGWITIQSDYERQLLFYERIYFSALGLVSLLILAYVVVSIALKKIWLSNYVLVGFGLLILGYITVIFLNITQEKQIYDSLWNVPSVYMGLGMLAEMLCFLLALGKRTQRTEQERNQLSTLNNILEEKVAQRTKELQTALNEAQNALLKGQTIERKRVASELHDNLGGLLAALKMTTNALDTHDLHPQEQEIYAQMVTMIDDANRQVRSLSHNLLPEELEKTGLVASLQTLINKLNVSHNTAFEFYCENLDERLHKSIEFNLYTIVLELCNNILKHSNASRASIELINRNGKMQLLVADNGKGFKPNEHDANGMGLKNLYDRAKAIGAFVKVHSEKGEGTLITLKFSVPSYSEVQN